jgi:prophage regulatory protein
MNNQIMPRKLIRLPTVLDRVGLKRSTIYKRMKADAFPHPVKIGGASVWVEAEVDAYVAQLMSARQASPTTTAST